MGRRSLVLAFACLMALPAVGCGSSSSPAPAGPAPVIDLIVGTRRYDAGAGVYIFRDVLNATGISADVVLDNAGSGIDNGGRIAVWNDTLVVSNRDGDNILVFRDIPTLMSGDAPDAVLSGFSDPNGVFISPAGDIYACDRNNDQVRIYRDITTVMTGDGPDATINTRNGTVECLVIGTRLFVACRYDEGWIQVWDNAAGLTGGEAPAAEIILSEARRLGHHNGVLWARGSNQGGVFGWSNPDTLMTGDAADRAAFGLVPTQDRGDFDFSGNTMWLCNQWEDREVIARVDISNPLVTNAQATIDEDFAGYEAIYDVRHSQNYLFCSVRDNGFLIIYNDAAGFGTDAVPDRYIFDPRMDDVKEIRLIER